MPSCLGLLPVTGLPMPMVSYGGSGMIINMSLIGILLNISQAKELLGIMYGYKFIMKNINILITGGGIRTSFPCLSDWGRNP